MTSRGNKKKLLRIVNKIIFNLLLIYKLFIYLWNYKKFFEIAKKNLTIIIA